MPTTRRARTQSLGQAIKRPGSAVAGPRNQGLARPSRPEGPYPHLLKSRSLEAVPGSPAKSQKEGQKKQGEVKELGRTAKLN